MRTKSFLIVFCCIVAISILLIVLNQQKPTFQDIITTTHQQIRSFTKDTLSDDTKTFVIDDKYLAPIGLSTNPRLFPKSTWQNSSLPVFVTYVMEGEESQAVGVINNISKILPNNTILVYNLGLGNYGLRTMLNYCGGNHCQIITFSLNDFPSHVQDDNLHAFRPLIIQDALQRTGAIFFLESSTRFFKNTTAEHIKTLYESVLSGTGILAWRMDSYPAVSSLTHKKMFEYFHTDSDNFIFSPMVSGSYLLIVNTENIHKDIMLPWVLCAITRDCIVPIGAQSAGCRFDKKPQYRYSGCHSYDTSALNIVLGLKFKFDYMRYSYDGSKMFTSVTLDDAINILREFEQNTTTTAGKNQLLDALQL
ncbi:hypothetical protein MML48_scaffold00002779 [Holotrichia oblita]|nr:hypothetical protein MML48_scaffold00002779 [Holotrichia oblita]